MGGTPATPTDPNVSALASQQASLANYPSEYMVNALAQEGGTGTIAGKTYNFSGLSPAEVSGGVSKQMAQALLQIQQTNDPAMIQQRLQDLQQADPAGYAAYGQLFSQIMQSAQNPTDPNQPLSGQLQSQITTLLNQGPTLTTGPNSTTENIQNAVRSGQVGQGIYLGNEPAMQEAAALDTAGLQQQATNQNEAMAYNNAGVSPQDVQYRQIQQALSNLGAFQNGTNPTAEFGSLSGAQNGATPFTTYGPNQAQPNLGAGLQGIQNANAEYAGNVNYANQMVNPFLAGIGSLANGIGSAVAGNNPTYNALFGGSNNGGNNSGMSGQDVINSIYGNSNGIEGLLPQSTLIDTPSGGSTYGVQGGVDYNPDTSFNMASALGGGAGSAAT